MGCAFNFTGSKFRYKDEVLPLLPQEDELRVLDVFYGGGSLTSQMNPTWKFTVNDKESRMINLHRMFQQQARCYHSTDKVVDDVVKFNTTLIKGRDDKQGYLRAVDHYNNQMKDASPTVRSCYLYTLLYSSFSNQIRWNSEGDWNVPFGKRWFNPSMQKSLTQYLHNLKERDITFESKDFRDFNLEDYNLIISDSPYSYNGKSNAVYNESGGWQLKDLTDLLSKLDRYHEQGGVFVFFNEIITKSIDNPVIQC